MQQVTRNVSISQKKRKVVHIFVIKFNLFNQICWHCALCNCWKLCQHNSLSFSNVCQKHVLLLDGWWSAQSVEINLEKEFIFFFPWIISQKISSILVLKFTLCLKDKQIWKNLLVDLNSYCQICVAFLENLTGSTTYELKFLRILLQNWSQELSSNHKHKV